MEYLPVLFQGAKAADGHLAGPAFLGGRPAAHFAEHHQLSERVALDSGFVELLKEYILSAFSLSRGTGIRSWALTQSRALREH